MEIIKVGGQLKWFDVHHRLYIALVLTAIVYFISWRTVPMSQALLFAWIAFTSSGTMMSWAIIFLSHPGTMKKFTLIGDTGRYTILLLVAGISIVNLFAFFYLLPSAGSSTDKVAVNTTSQIIISTLISWFMLHSMFTTHYAHLYYRGGLGDRSGSGLKFPGTKAPDYFDFAYFSFGIGMAFQASDIRVTAPIFRRTALLHSLIAFAYNTIILTLSISVISDLIHTVKK